MRILDPLGDAGCPVAITPSPGAPPGPAQELGIANCGVSAMVSRDDGHDISERDRLASGLPESLPRSF